MAVEHTQLPITAVQFHPESIMSLEKRAGHRLVQNVVREIDGIKSMKMAV